MFFDNFAIPKDAPHAAEAHAFIDYMLRADIAAKNSNFLGYANGNLASQKLMDKAVLDDKTVYPDEATLASLYVVTARDQRVTRLANRLWTKIKTGQ
jgi:putrescine transport system substrate-binding protein